MPDAKQILEIGRLAMGKVGWFKSAKGGGWASSQGIVAGVLVQVGLSVEISLVLAVAAVTGANTLWQYLRKYEIVGR